MGEVAGRQPVYFRGRGRSLKIKPPLPPRCLLPPLWKEGKKKKEPASVGCVGTGVRVRQEGRERESCCVYICKAAGRQQRVRLRLWPNLSSSLLPQTHQSSKTGPSRPRRTLGGPRTGVHGACAQRAQRKRGSTHKHRRPHVAHGGEVFVCFSVCVFQEICGHTLNAHVHAHVDRHYICELCSACLKKLSHKQK